LARQPLAACGRVGDVQGVAPAVFGFEQGELGAGQVSVTSVMAACSSTMALPVVQVATNSPHSRPYSNRVDYPDCSDAEVAGL
jgi:hypothetical protein